MANKKFSEFTLKTDPANVDFVVGYDGTDNVRIDPSNIGGGATNLNELTDCLVDTDSLYVGEVPSGLSGNPPHNTILGIDAGTALTSGVKNTFIGSDAGTSLTTANENTAVGHQALQNQNTIGNTALGALSGGTGSGGAYSVYVGYKSGQNNATNGHISIGGEAGYSNTSGASNTNIGFQAGYANTTGGSNTNIGYEAGKSITGSSNTFVGTGVASASSGSGFDNTSLGQNSLFSLTSGSANAIIGRKSGLAITTGSNNVALGYQSLYSETSGQRNTAIGYEALKNQNQQFAAHNTAVGWQADDGNTSGYYRTNIGASTGGTSTGSNITNIGFGAQESSSTVSNEVTLGNSSVATLRCAVTSITSLSDERDKTDIKDLGYGLAFIDALQPREFVWDNRPETNKDGEEFYSSNKGKKDFGFIAQEVKELDNDTLRLVYDENPDKLELSYGKLVPVLVQAIKELKAEIELLKS